MLSYSHCYTHEKHRDILTCTFVFLSDVFILFHSLVPSLLPSLPPSLLSPPSQSPDDASLLVCSVLRAFRSVMQGCEVMRDSFEPRVGYSRLITLVEGVCTPNKAILQEAMNMVCLCVCVCVCVCVWCIL